VHVKKNSINLKAGQKYAPEKAGKSGVAEAAPVPRILPDCMFRLRAIYRDRTLLVSGAKLLAEDRNRY
jgi:hypothetical protein